MNDPTRPILCLGATPAAQRTMVFNRFEVDRVNRAAQVIASASGKAINAARILRRLGEPVSATGFLGGDTGRWIRRELDGLGISHHFVEVQPSTRNCVTIVDRSAAATELVEESQAVGAPAYEQLLAVLQASLNGASMLLLSGSLPPDAPADFYARCTRLANDAAIPVILDAQGEPLTHALAAKPMLVKPNQSELEQTLGRKIESPRQMSDAIGALLSRGPKYVVVTIGASGAMAGDGSAVWRISSPAVKAVNAVGSGDAFAAGLAAALRLGQSLPEACTLAAACGAANALQPASGDLQAPDVAHLRSEVTVTKL